MFDDLKTGVTNNKINRINAESYVDRYGKESPGFITFTEFKDIYMTHVHYADEMSEKKPKPDINKLTALFNAIDTQNRKKISREDFKNFIINKQPSGNFLEKLFRGNGQINILGIPKAHGEVIVGGAHFIGIEVSDTAVVK